MWQVCGRCEHKLGDSCATFSDLLYRGLAAARGSKHPNDIRATNWVVKTIPPVFNLVQCLFDFCVSVFNNTVAVVTPATYMYMYANM